MRVLIALFLATAMAAHAQSAKVIKLSDEDAVKARKLDEARKAMDDLQQSFHDQIIRKYLVTTERQQRCCDNIWTDPEDKKDQASSIIGTATIFSGGITLYGNHDDRCLTPAEQAERKAAKEKQDAEEAAYAKAHPTKYYRDGWRDGFQYSEGFQYIVPAEAHQLPTSTGPCGVMLTGN